MKTKEGEEKKNLTSPGTELTIELVWPKDTSAGQTLAVTGQCTRTGGEPY